MTDLKKQLRPAIPSIAKKDNISTEEKFQNEVLRPIIKLQNNLISSYFEHNLERKKNRLSEVYWRSNNSLHSQTI